MAEGSSFRKFWQVQTQTQPAESEGERGWGAEEAIIYRELYSGLSEN
jgi:hypothetical protein